MTNMTKTTLQTKIDALKAGVIEQGASSQGVFHYRGDYHIIDGYDIANVIDYIKDDEEFKDFEELEEKLDYDGRWSELSDRMCHIYYSDIAKWFGENYTAIDEYVSEFGEMAQDDRGEPDIMKTIQCAFIVSYERDLKEAMKVFIDNNN